MMIYKGRSVYGGIAIGKMQEYKKKESDVKRHKIYDSVAETERFINAKNVAIEELNKLCERAYKEVGEMNAKIFEVHAVMLEDLDYIESVVNIITSQMVNAEYAVAVTGDNFATMFGGMDDEYMKERAADVRDISNRVINVLGGTHENSMIGPERAIILADDLAPSETVMLDKSKVLAIVTRYGSTNSHTAILARTMNIPALIGVDYPSGDGEHMAIVDGYEGLLIVNPDSKTMSEYENKLHEEEKRIKLLDELRGKKTVTEDGKDIMLYANIGSVSDVAYVLKNDAAGIGLFRSEFLYLSSKDYPTEEEQFIAYKTVAENMAGKKVIIRTLDIGADKQIDYINLDKEENPAMGFRAIRICLTRKDIFRTQLRALYRASYYGNIAIMFPMIVSLWEIRAIKEIVGEVMTELRNENRSIREVELGVMIETPAAVMISDELAKEVDFFSIGTNDLTQYTLAIDRQNAKLDDFYDSHHPAVLAMIQKVIDNGHQNNIWVGICGELGADITMTESFIRMGIDELSVNPSMILPIRDRIRKIRYI